jgi:hypothetical protein
MRILCAVIFLAALGLTASGCSDRSGIGAPDGPMVDAFVGRVTHDGKPVTLPAKSQLKVMQHGSSWSMGVPLQTDGTFTIGKMPVGKYSVILETPPKEGSKGAPGQKYSVPQVLSIEQGKTEYTIELGKNWKL